MFEELKSQIAVQSVQKIKKIQKELDRDFESSYSDHENEEQSDNELADRLEMFKVLMEEKQNYEGKKVRKNHFEKVKWAKTVKENELLKEQIKINQSQHERELQYIKEQYQREMDVLKAEIEKYQYLQKKQLKEEGIVLAVKKENRQLIQFSTQSQQTAQRVMKENGNLKKQILHLKNTLKQRQQSQAFLSVHKHLQSQTQKTLKRELANLQAQKSIDSERRRYLEATVNKLRLQNDELMREVDQMKMNTNREKEQIQGMSKQEILRLEEENRELRRRNQKLEESFIDHLTQTSLNLQQNIKNNADKSGKNTTLYLQQTPIKSRSKQREQPRSPQSEEDPEKSQCMVKKCGCEGQLIRMKSKLKQANNKIVDLLQQKCQVYRQK